MNCNEKYISIPVNKYVSMRHRIQTESKDFWLQQRKQDTGKWPEHEVMYMLGPVQAVLLVLHFPLIPVC